MQFVKPIPFQEAIDKLGERSIIGSKLTSAEWSDVPLALRERAFFSSTIESVRFLQRGRDGIMDFLTGNKETLENGQPALKTGSRAQFVKDMQQFLTAEGVDRTTGGLTDITSQRRLSLIFDTQVRQADDFGYWKQGQDADVLNEFPAQRFIRVQEVDEPRDWHTQFEDGVWLKTDLDAWIRINQDFGVPWGPWGWGCGHDVEDVDRDEAEEAGLITPGQTLQPAEQAFNDRLGASTRGLDRDMLKLLDESFGEQIVIEDDRVRWRGQERSPSTQPSPPGEGVPSASPFAMDDLATQYRNADFGTRRRLADQARERIAVPAAERQPVNLDMRARSGAVRAAARGGADIVSRYTSPALVQRTKIEVFATKQRRAFHRSGGIYLNSRTSNSTGAHEIMHGVEIQNPEVLRSSAEFLLRRGAGETPQSLRTLTGHRGYQSDEIAFDDDWAERSGSVYAGKVYSHAGRSVSSADQIRATEVLTMGIERLHADPLEFYTNDRDWFEFVVRTLRQL